MRHHRDVGRWVDLREDWFLCGLYSMDGLAERRFRFQVWTDLFSPGPRPDSNIPGKSRDENSPSPGLNVGLGDVAVHSGHSLQ